MDGTASSIKKTDAKAAVEKLLEKLEKIPAWQLTKVPNKTEGVAEARNMGKTVQFILRRSPLFGAPPFGAPP